MLVTQDLTTPRKAPSSVALGFFDGVHAGHRAVIGAAVEAARREGLTPRVFTFRPEGADASRPVSKSGLTLLQREEQKEAVLEELGVEEVICPPFETFRSMTPEQFVQGFLGETLHARVLVCGFNYHFGRGGQAGVEELRALCAPLGIQVEALPPVLWQGEVVSSTRIRQCIREGQIEEAAAMLCAPFTLAAASGWPGPSPGPPSTSCSRRTSPSPAGGCTGPRWRLAAGDGTGSPTWGLSPPSTKRILPWKPISWITRGTFTARSFLSPCCAFCAPNRSLHRSRRCPRGYWRIYRRCGSFPERLEPPLHTRKEPAGTRFPIPS